MAISSIVGDWGIPGAQILYLHVGVVAFILLIMRWRIPESTLWLKAKQNEIKKTCRNNFV